MEYPGDGMVLQNGRLIRDEIKADLDKERDKEEVTMELLLEIGNGIHDSIQLETDHPSRHEDKKMPILNLRVWIQNIEGRNLIVYEHYRKEVATKATVHARSALPMRQKKTILTQELLTIMKNCSPNLEEAKRVEHINQFMKRLQFAGYNKEFRFDVFNSASKALEIQGKRAEDQGVPLNRPRQWERRRRKQEKEEKKRSWYKRNGEESVIFVPCTPEGRLIKIYKEQIKKSGFKGKVRLFQNF